MVIDDQSFFEYFTNSLPSSLDLFITLYEDNSYNVDLLCDRFAKHEMRRKLADAKDGKAGGTSDSSLALFGQSASSSSKGKGKERKKRDLRNITCYGCGKEGHVKAKCLDGEKEEKLKRRTISPDLQRRRRRRAHQKYCLGHYTWQCLTAHLQVLEAPRTRSMSTPEPHTTSFLHEAICTPIRNLQSPLRYQQPTGGRSMLTVLGPCEWQHQPMV